MKAQTVRLEVNGRPVSAEVAPRTHLADFLRDELLLTGTHLGCEHGVCGACTVMIDGAPARACIAFALACDGRSIRTVEGFGDDPLMAVLREAFARHHALQCGYCTPGMLITAHDIVSRIPDADERRIREELGGNLCRCTGYQGIVEAIESVLAEAPAVASRVAAPAPRARSASWPRLGAERPRSGLARAGDGGRDGRYRIHVPVAADAVWAELKDVQQVARCLPGASVSGDVSHPPLDFRMDVALGPMRVAFVGTARVEYRDAERRGRVEGRGEDARSRSSGEGTLEFAVQGEGTDGCVLEIALDYVIKGPLAQFSRGPVVDAVVAQLLDRFATNVTTLARGGDVRETAAVGGLGMALGALWRWLRVRFRG